MVTSTVKILSIGDQDESSTPKKTIAKYERHNFEDDFKKRLAVLLLKTSIPIPIVENWSTVESFGAASIKEGNKPRRYYFLIGHGHSYSKPTIISGPTFNARKVMYELKKILKGENWVGDNVIEVPLRDKSSKEFYNSDQYIQHVVSQALDAASGRLVQYIYYLQQKHLHKKS